MLSRLARAALAAALLAGCAEVPPPQPVSEPAPRVAPAPRLPPTTELVDQQVKLVDKAMGTEVILVAPVTERQDEAAIRTALEAAFAEIVRIEGLMTTWTSTSEIASLNAEAGKAPVKVSEETLEVLAKSLWIAEHSEGTFDVTFASMGKVWRFDEDKIALLPDPDELEQARKRIDYRKLELDPEAGTAFLAGDESKVSLGGIAKGYAIDRATAILRERGLDSFFARAGGDLYIAGRKPNGKPWRVGVRDPRGPATATFASIAVEDHAFSTAGDYERAFIKNGKRYHHIIDPRTGYPATASRSVTIWAKDALTADAIDDAVFILGPEKGLALVESIDDCGAIIVDADNQVHVSKRLEGKVTIHRDPTPGI